MVAGAAAATIGVPAAAASESPSPSQERAAIRRATHSRTLWATVNICNTRHHPDVIGLRGQMPALGFPAAQEMTVRLFYWNFKRSRFELIQGVEQRLSLGTITHGTVQAGAEFRFKPPVILSGEITFRWYREGRLLASITRLTSHGDRGVNDSDPPGYSTATCRMGE